MTESLVHICQFAVDYIADYQTQKYVLCGAWISVLFWDTANWHQHEYFAICWKVDGSWKWGTFFRRWNCVVVICPICNDQFHCARVAPHKLWISPLPRVLFYVRTNETWKSSASCVCCMSLSTKKSRNFVSFLEIRLHGQFKTISSVSRNKPEKAAFKVPSFLRLSFR